VKEHEHLAKLSFFMGTTSRANINLC